MNTTSLACRVSARRKKLFNNRDWNGIDFIEVADDQRSVCLHFFGHVPAHVTVDNIRIEGGRRIRDVRATAVEIDRAHDPELDDCLRITLDKPGDFSTYRLCLVQSPESGHGRGLRPYPGLDPRYACIDFTFKVGCPADLDCKSTPVCPPDLPPAPAIDYLAKDYGSFRQLMLDRLAFTIPDWKERHAADIGVTVVEALAYAADYMSYRQDAVATEAYLDTARLRISVRRHARLVDYRMHEGCNSRAWVTIDAKDNETLPAGRFYFITGFSDLPANQVLVEDDLSRVPATHYEVFQPILPSTEPRVPVYAAHSTIPFYTWGDEECCLPKGTTRATLLDGFEHEAPPPQSPVEAPPPATAREADASARAAHAPSKVDHPHGSHATSGRARTLKLKPGDVLIFEEVIGPTTGNPADADPTHRHAVRLTRVVPNVDRLLGNVPLLDVEWGPADALPFSLCLSAQLPAPDCRRIDGISVARGNVFLVDHGRSVSETLGPVGGEDSPGECQCDGAIVETVATPQRFRCELSHAPLTFRAAVRQSLPASRMLDQDPRLALPQIQLKDPTAAPDAAAWEPRYDLLDSTADDPHFVVEMDDDGDAHLRFGDGDAGRLPEAGISFDAQYRVGVGVQGNVGRDRIDRLVLVGERLSASLQPRNPMPAVGGTDPEPVAAVKLFAPGAFRERLARAITADDYAALAAADHHIQRAAARFAWTGSWYEAQVALDPVGAESASAGLLAGTDRHLEPFRRVGHDLAILQAEYVPIDLALEVCVLPHYTRGDVKAALLEVFSARLRRDGTPGFFHPDNLTFGGGLYVSAIVAAAKGVDGVEAVRVTRLQRLDGFDTGTLDAGVLALAPTEIAQLDNDPNLPENGQLELVLRGGR